MKFLSHPDTVVTASDLEKLALGLLAEIPQPSTPVSPPDAPPSCCRSEIHQSRHRYHSWDVLQRLHACSATHRSTG